MLPEARSALRLAQGGRQEQEQDLPAVQSQAPHSHEAAAAQRHRQSLQQAAGHEIMQALLAAGQHEEHLCQIETLTHSSSHLASSDWTLPRHLHVQAKTHEAEELVTVVSC